MVDRAFTSTPYYPAAIPVTAANRYRLEVGRAGDGRIVSWDLGAPAPHAVIIGEDAAGRTDAQVVVAVSALRRGFRVHIADPSRVEFAALRGWPGVCVARTLDDMVSLVERLHAEMTRRYRHPDRGTDGLIPEILILDQWPQLRTLAARLGRPSNIHRGGHPLQAPVDEMLYAGRAVRIHLLLGLARPHPRTLSVMRDNTGFRLTLDRAPRHRRHAIVQDGGETIDAVVYRLPLLNLDLPAEALCDVDAGARRSLLHDVRVAQAPHAWTPSGRSCTR